MQHLNLNSRSCFLQLNILSKDFKKSTMVKLHTKYWQDRLDKAWTFYKRNAKIMFKSRAYENQSATNTCMKYVNDLENDKNNDIFGTYNQQEPSGHRLKDKTPIQKSRQTL